MTGHRMEVIATHGMGVDLVCSCGAELAEDEQGLAVDEIVKASFAHVAEVLGE